MAQINLQLFGSYSAPIPQSPLAPIISDQIRTQLNSHLKANSLKIKQINNFTPSPERSLNTHTHTFIIKLNVMKSKVGV